MKKEIIVEDIKSNINILENICYKKIQKIENILNDKSLENIVLCKIKKLRLEVQETYYYIYITFIDIINRRNYMDEKNDLSNLEELLRELNNIKIIMMTNNQMTLNDAIKNFKKSGEIKEDIFKMLDFAEHKIEEIKNEIKNKKEQSIDNRSYIEDEVQKVSNTYDLEVNTIKENAQIKESYYEEEISQTKQEENNYNNIHRSSSSMYLKE